MGGGFGVLVVTFRIAVTKLAVTKLAVIDITATREETISDI